MCPFPKYSMVVPKNDKSKEQRILGNSYFKLPYISKSVLAQKQ